MLKKGYKVVYRTDEGLLYSSCYNMNNTVAIQYQLDKVIIAPEGRPIFVFEDLESANYFKDGSLYRIILECIYLESKTKLTRIADLINGSVDAFYKLAPEEYNDRYNMNYTPMWDVPLGTVFADEIFLTKQV